MYIDIDGAASLEAGGNWNRLGLREQQTTEVAVRVRTTNTVVCVVAGAELADG